MYNGSSVTTAIAAGSVGLLLYLNKLNARGSGGMSGVSGVSKVANNLKSHSDMKQALESMCKTSKSTNSRCPRFGDTFGSGFNEFMFMLERDRFFAKLGQIMEELKV